MKGKQHEEHHEKNCAHHGQKHVAADEQSVHYLKRKNVSVSRLYEQHNKSVYTETVCSEWERHGRLSSISSVNH